VVKVGTPLNNQIGVWTGDGTLEGEAVLTYNTNTFGIFNQVDDAKMDITSSVNTKLAKMTLGNDGTDDLVITNHGTTNASSNLGTTNAGKAAIASDEILKILTTASKEIQFGTNDTLALTIDSSQNATFAANVVVSAFLNLGASTELTIAAGVITATRSFHSVDTESDASTDDLVTINGGTEGDILFLRADSSARTIVLKDQTGNLRLAGDFSMDNDQDTITLHFEDPNWLERARSSNGA